MTDTPIPNWTEDWGDPMVLSHCPSCDGNFIVSLSVEIELCPYCGNAVLTYLEETADKPVYSQAPELMLPFSVSKETFQQNVAQSVKNNRFSPADLTPQNLNSRLQPLYLPFGW